MSGPAVSRLRRNEWFQGEDRDFVFIIEEDDTDGDPSTWNYEFVVRDPVTTCSGPRDDPGTGTIRITKVTADMTRSGNTITVPILRADTLNLEPADYYAALWRTDSGDERPLAILAYAHLTAVPRQSS